MVLDVSKEDSGKDFARDKNCLQCCLSTPRLFISWLSSEGPYFVQISKSPILNLRCEAKSAISLFKMQETLVIASVQG